MEEVICNIIKSFHSISLGTLKQTAHSLTKMPKQGFARITSSLVLKCRLAEVAKSSGFSSILAKIALMRRWDLNPPSLCQRIESQLAQVLIMGLTEEGALKHVCESPIFHLFHSPVL